MPGPSPAAARSAASAGFTAERAAAAAGDDCSSGGSAGSVTSSDPNAKTGPAGFGPANFVRGDGLFPYRIDFENDPTASAPAQRVDVFDQLSANLDGDTFEFTEVGFGGTLLVVPSGSRHFHTTVPVTFNNRDFQVEIALDFDAQTGRVLATFASLDPATNLPPDVLTGFLPPEDGSGRGQGHFSYLVRAAAGLATGTEIRNTARIRFDFGEIIDTNQVAPHDPTQGTDPLKEALLTIDATPPTSSVQPLPATTASTNFPVAWSGTDDGAGSGVASYDVFVSIDGGPFTPWQTATTQTSATYPGAVGHAYAFYSVATDNVGLRQPTPIAAQASTRVVPPDTTPPTSTVLPLPAVVSSASFPVAWSGDDGSNGSGIASYDVYVSDNGGPFTAFQTGTTRTSATFTGQDGHGYAFYSIAADNVGNRQATPAGPQASTVVLLPPVPLPPVPILPMVVRPVGVSLGTRGHGPKRTLMARVTFSDGTSLEIRSPLQKPRFRKLTVALADLDGDGNFDAVIFTARNVLSGRKVRRTAFSLTAPLAR
jgi:hypothetical protein